MTEEEKIVEYAKRKQALHISLGYEDAESEWYLERLIEDQIKNSRQTSGKTNHTVRGVFAVPFAGCGPPAACRYGSGRETHPCRLV